MIRFKNFIVETNLFKDNRDNGVDVVLDFKGSSKAIRNAFANYALHDKFTTSNKYAGEVTDLQGSTGDVSLILKDKNNKYVRINGASTSISSALHIVKDVKDVGPLDIKFSNGKLTKLGESIQCVGFFVSIDSNTPIEYNDSQYKSIVKSLTSLPLSGGVEAVIDYFSEDVFNRYMSSVINLVSGASNAVKDLGYKPDGVIHSEISTYYKIAKGKNYTTAHTKENTADCVLYTGTNFLDNLKRGEVSFDAHLLSIIIDGKVTNTFYQISLKNNGRLGDLASLNSIANKFKYITDDYHNILDDGVVLNEGLFASINGLVSGTKVLISKGKKLLLKGIDRIRGLYNALMGGLKSLATNAKGHDKDLMKKKPTISRHISEAKTSLPKENDIVSRYGDEDGFNLLKKKLNDANARSKKILIALGADNAKFKIDEYSVMYNSISNSSTKELKFANELRLLYFNVVSALTAEDYLKSISSIKDFYGLEIESIYGNTSLPLIKVSGYNKGHYLEKLPLNAEPRNEVSKLPVFGMQATLSGHHMAYYFHILSVTKDNPAYMQVQLRTKGSSQYVVDGNIFINTEKFNKKYKF